MFYLFIYFYFWLCWVFISVLGLSLVAASGGHYSSRCAGLSLSLPPLLRSTGSRRAGSVVVAHGLSCSAACGIFPDQGPNPCPLHWQADSQPLRHQGSPLSSYFKRQSRVPCCNPGPRRLGVNYFWWDSERLGAEKCVPHDSTQWCLTMEQEKRVGQVQGQRCGPA